MSVEIHQPEIEALIQQRMASGAFHDVEDLLLHALKTAPAAPTTRTTGKDLVELFEPIRGLLTDEEVDTLFARNPCVARPIDFT